MLKLTPPPEHLKAPKPDPQHLKVDMRCQLCDHHWSYEFFGILWDVGEKIAGCPSCAGVRHATGRASLQMLRYHVVDNPYMVKERKRR